MDLKSAIFKIGLSRIKFSPSSVCLLKDDVIKLPDDEENRDKHIYRTVVILSNDFVCESVDFPLVTVAPTSSKMKWKRSTEIVVEPSATNGLERSSRIMLSHLQPILKTHIEKEIGKLSIDDWDELMTQIVKNFDRA